MVFGRVFYKKEGNQWIDAVTVIVVVVTVGGKRMIMTVAIASARNKSMVLAVWLVVVKVAFAVAR